MSRSEGSAAPELQAKNWCLIGQAEGLVAPGGLMGSL
jgi:hypothetical protein